MITKTILYFINNAVINGNNINIKNLNDRKLLLNSDLVIENNIIVKSRQTGQGIYISDLDIASEILTFDGVVITRPQRIIDNLDKETIISNVASYLTIQKFQLDPIIDKMALTLRKMYPDLSKDHSGDWALEFINTDGDCRRVFERLDMLYPIK